MPFQPGHRKFGGKRKGSRNRVNQIKHAPVEEVFARLGVAPERLAEITPLQAMLACMHMALEAGDRAGVLAAASAAGPHAKLSSVDMKVRGELTEKTTDELRQEIAEIERRMLTIDGTAEAVH
jgi:hypothetical protein